MHTETLVDFLTTMTGSNGVSDCDAKIDGTPLNLSRAGIQLVSQSLELSPGSVPASLGLYGRRPGAMHKRLLRLPVSF